MLIPSLTLLLPGPAHAMPRPSPISGPHPLADLLVSPPTDPPSALRPHHPSHPGQSLMPVSPPLRANLAPLDLPSGPTYTPTRICPHPGLEASPHSPALEVLRADQAAEPPVHHDGQVRAERLTLLHAVGARSRELWPGLDGRCQALGCSCWGPSSSSSGPPCALNTSCQAQTALFPGPGTTSVCSPTQAWHPPPSEDHASPCDPVL